MIIKVRKPWIPERIKTNESWAFDKRYHTTKWRKYRASFLKDNPLCCECKEAGKIVPATIVGHIIPVSKDNSDHNFWSTKNHKPLCESCNNRKL